MKGFECSVYVPPLPRQQIAEHTPCKKGGGKGGKWPTNLGTASRKEATSPKVVKVVIHVNKLPNTLLARKGVEEVVKVEIPG